ncbi:MAG: hypothetical protein J6Y70_01585 [Bacilli bacterium]|nr:hypothetical protein [Bacilli bacterium]
MLNDLNTKNNNFFLKIKKDFFLRKLIHLSKIAAPNKINNKLSFINIFSDEDDIIFSATNETTEINIIVKKNNDNILDFSNGAVSISCKELIEVINTIPNEVITISVFDNVVLEITEKTSTYRLNISENNNIQKITLEKEDFSFKIKTTQLINLISQTTYINTIKDNISNSLLVNIESSENNIIASVISKYRMAKKQIKLDNYNFQDNKNFKIAISIKAINDILKILDNNKEIINLNVSISNKKIFFYTKDIIISLTLSNSNFSDIKLKNDYSSTLTIKNQSLSEEIKGLCIMSNRKVKMEVTKDIITFSTDTDSEYFGKRILESNSNDSKKFIFNGDKVEIEFDGFFVLETLKNFKTDENVNIFFNGYNKPFLIKNLDNDSFHLIAPIIAV